MFSKIWKFWPIAIHVPYMRKGRERARKGFAKRAMMGIKMINLKGDWHTRQVWLNGKELLPTKNQWIENHGTDGFNWGYDGSGPAQLSLAILLELLAKKEALEHYQAFKWEVITRLPTRSFRANIDFDRWLKKRRAAMGGV